jgi:hypothetical protein
MKISRTTQWVLTIGIFAVILVGAGIVYGRQIAEQRQLGSDIARAQQDFTKYAKQKEELEARLSQAKARVASAQSQFSSYSAPMSIEIDEILLQAAHDTNVTITSLTSTTAKDEKINDITCGVFSLSITAEAEVLPSLLNFSDRVSQSFSTSAITSAEIDMQGKPTITLKLKIYGYEGK